MSSHDTDELAELIAQRGREVLVQRLRDAFAHQAAMRDAVDLDPGRLEQFVQDAAARAGGALWRRSLAEAAMEQLEIDLPEALDHPALARAQELVQMPAYVPAPAALEPATTAAQTDAAEATYTAEIDGAEIDGAEIDGTEMDAAEIDRAGEPVPSGAEPKALRLSAVHLNGIESLRHGDRDIELRLSNAGLDVLKRSTGAAIGRLEWREIEKVELPPPRRGLRSGRRARELHVSTGRGEAQFELPGLSEEELHEHLEPTLARLAGKSARGTDAKADGG